MKKLIYSKKIAPFVFIAPFVLTVLIFWLMPIGKSVLMSFQNYLPGMHEWIGVKNYRQLFRDRIFLIAVKNTFRFTIGMLLLLVQLFLPALLRSAPGKHLPDSLSPCAAASEGNVPQPVRRTVLRGYRPALYQS